MSRSEIHWMAVFNVHDGALEEFRRLAGETAETARANEPGQLTYEWYLSPDGRTCHVDERYTDEAAALAHLHGEAATEKLPALLGSCDLASLEVYSKIRNDDLRTALAGLGARFWDDLAGDRREAPAT